MPRSPDRIDDFVGTRIVALRAEAGLSQAALASRLGISFQQVQKYEAGTNRVSASRLHHLASILNALVESFFPPRPTATVAEPSEPQSLGVMPASPEGRMVATGFDLIGDRKVRRALAVLVGALTRAA